VVDGGVVVEVVELGGGGGGVWVATLAAATAGHTAGAATTRARAMAGARRYTRRSRLLPRRIVKPVWATARVPRMTGSRLMAGRRPE
jgi:hypothetical protein